MDTKEVLSRLAKQPGGKKSRKWGRNYKWDGTSHSLTKYRGGKHRERNKARKVAKHLRRLALAARRKERHATDELSVKDDRP